MEMANGSTNVLTNLSTNIPIAVLTSDPGIPLPTNSPPPSNGKQFNEVQSIEAKEGTKEVTNTKPVNSSPSYERFQPKPKAKHPKDSNIDQENQSAFRTEKTEKKEKQEQQDKQENQEQHDKQENQEKTWAERVVIPTEENQNKQEIEQPPNVQQETNKKSPKKEPNEVKDHQNHSKEEQPKDNVESNGETKLGNNVASTCYLSNLPFTTTPNEVSQLFSKLGVIKTINLKALKGFGFIEFDSPETAERIIRESKEKAIVLNGRVLTVEERRVKDPMEKNQFSSRRKDQSPNKFKNNGNQSDYHNFNNQSKQPKPFLQRTLVFKNTKNNFFSDRIDTQAQ